MIVHEYHKIGEMERAKALERESMGRKFSIDNIIQRHSLQSDSLNNQYMQCNNSSIKKFREGYHYPDSLDGRVGS